MRACRGVPRRWRLLPSSFSESNKAKGRWELGLVVLGLCGCRALKDDPQGWAFRSCKAGVILRGLRCGGSHDPQKHKTAAPCGGFPSYLGGKKTRPSTNGRDRSKLQA